MRIEPPPIKSISTWTRRSRYTTAVILFVFVVLGFYYLDANMFVNELGISWPDILIVVLGGIGGVFLFSTLVEGLARPATVGFFRYRTKTRLGVLGIFIILVIAFFVIYIFAVSISGLMAESLLLNVLLVFIPWTLLTMESRAHFIEKILVRLGYRSVSHEHVSEKQPRSPSRVYAYIRGAIASIKKRIPEKALVKIGVRVIREEPHVNWSTWLKSSASKYGLQFLGLYSIPLGIYVIIMYFLEGRSNWYLPITIIEIYYGFLLLSIIFHALVAFLGVRIGSTTPIPRVRNTRRFVGWVLLLVAIYSFVHVANMYNDVMVFYPSEESEYTGYLDVSSRDLTVIVEYTLDFVMILFIGIALNMAFRFGISLRDSRAFALLRFLWLLISYIYLKYKKFWLYVFPPMLLIVGSVIYFDYRIDRIETALGGREKLECNRHKVIEDVSDSVVRIIGGEGEGTGFFVDDRTIITNHHVVEFEPSPKIVYQDDEFENGTIIAADPDSDLALIKVERKMPSLNWRLTEPQIGEDVLSFGFPDGGDIAGSVTVNDTTVSALRKSDILYANKYVQVAGGLISGMSGGPMMDMCGKVVGVNVAGSYYGDDIGWAIHADVARAFHNAVITSGPEHYESAITKIIFAPDESPEETVRAYYNYLKTRNYRKAYRLLSNYFIGDVSFREWVVGFQNQLDTTILRLEVDSKNPNRIFVTLGSTDFVSGGFVYQVFKGQWIVKEVDEHLKLWESNIEKIR